MHQGGLPVLVQAGPSLSSTTMTRRPLAVLSLRLRPVGLAARSPSGERRGPRDGGWLGIILTDKLISDNYRKVESFPRQITNR